jgi:hypothetical protein
VRKHRVRTGTAHAYNAVPWRAGNAAWRALLAATGTQNKSPKVSNFIPVFNSPIV